MPENWDQMTRKEKFAANEKRKLKKAVEEREAHFKLFPEEKRREEKEIRDKFVASVFKVLIPIGLALLVVTCMQYNAFDPDEGKTNLQRDAGRLCDAVGGCTDGKP